MTKIRYKRLLEHFTLEELLDYLQVPDHEALLNNAKYFNEQEADKRDKILEGYLSNKGLETVSRTITEIFAKIPDYANILSMKTKITAGIVIVRLSRIYSDV